MKVEIKKQGYNSFGALFFVWQEFHKSGIKKLIDSTLGIRSIYAKYSYSDIVGTLFLIFVSGGDCAEDAHSHLRKELESIPGNKVPSPDTILRIIKELSCENINYSSSSGIDYNFNTNAKMNSLLIDSLVLTGQLSKESSYDFDYDNQLIPTEKYDAKYSYKKRFGYFPGVATIGEHIVYVENRDANANVKFKQQDTLKRAYSLLEAQGISINRSRMDCGSYSKEIIEVVDTYSKLFYIRAMKSNDLYERVREIEKWTSVEINDKKYEVASLAFTSFAKEKNYRLVIMRELTSSLQTDLFTGDTFKYRSILTNDHQSSELDIILFYNQRGTSEKYFDVMNNDFGWSKLPCSFMKENTVFMIFMAMLKNFYSYFIKKISVVFTDVTPSSRLKRFIFRFITVVGKWVYKARQWHLQLFTDRPYDQLII